MMFNHKVKYITLFTASCLTACNPDVTVDAEAPTKQTTVQEKAFDAKTSEPTAYEMARTEVVPIQDARADRQYELYIKLPEGYKKSDAQKYPVIYTTDATSHMDMLSGSTEYLMPNVILVGISFQKDLNDKRGEFISRFRDYTFIMDEAAPVATGEASNHLSFIRKDVIKYVENNYRVDPNERTYFGYSLGAAFGAYILFEQPDTFKHYILGSPAFRPPDLAFIDELETKMAPQQQGISASVFVSIGELEKSEMETTKDFVSVLERRNQSGLKLTGLEIIENSDHGTAFPETIIRSTKWLSQLKSE